MKGLVPVPSEVHPFAPSGLRSTRWLLAFAALAALFAVGTSIAIPGLGLVVAGPIAAALAGAGAGAATGGLIGAMVGAGIPEEHARAYEEGVRKGGVLIGARERDDLRADELENDFKQTGGNVLGLR